MSDQTNAIVTEGFFLAPAATVNAILNAYQAKKDLIERVLKSGVDFGPIPGSDKPALLKPGAEKMNTFFGLCPVFEDVQTIEDWTGAEHGGEPFFYYRQRCNLYRMTNGQRVLVGSADGSCNSHETKYRYRWVNETDIPAGLERAKLKTRGGRISEFTFAVDKAETGGKYGKPAEYWQRFKDAIANGTATAVKKKIKSGEERDAWEIDSTLYRVPNDDISEVVNTILKMAQKRALVAATLIATAASDYFTQDIDDFIDGEWHDAQAQSSSQQAQPTTQAERKPAATNGGSNGHRENFNRVQFLVDEGLADNNFHAANIMNQCPKGVDATRESLRAWALERKNSETTEPPAN